MPTKEDKRQANTTAGRYVTIEEAAAEAGVVERTILRWKKDGKLHQIRDRLGHVRVSLEDVLACRQEPSDSPLRAQVKQLQAQIATLSEHQAELQHQVEELKSQHNLGEQLVQALANAQNGAGETTAWKHLASLLEGHRRSRTSGGGLAAMLAKRGLPPGTCRLKAFAKKHDVSMHEIKKLYTDGIIGLTVYQRPGNAIRNKLEWWITKAEQEALVAYWQHQGTPSNVSTVQAHAS